MVWVVGNFLNSPEQFISVFLLGITLGAIYALVALGYTLVYGIIELINFAHGDVFMWGTMVADHGLRRLARPERHPGVVCDRAARPA